MPLAVSGAILARYLQVRAQRERIQTAFGNYLPPEVVRRLADESVDFRRKAELVYGTCLATDAQQYTRLSETTPPAELRQLLNDYYQVLFAEVERYGGIVSDVIGDAMLAIWATPRPDSGARERACRAARAIALAVGEFNRARPGHSLPTRLGLHSGAIMLGSIGAEHHFEYRAVGDIVNTAFRIEGLNKYLGTALLVSAETLLSIPSIPAREVGSFLLAGKSSPIRICELLVNGDGESRHLSDFGAALERFRSQQWDDAGRLFQAILAQYPGDGVAKFYATLCQKYQAEGSDSFVAGAIRLEAK
jgi:adenylate cyclase